MLFLRRRLVSLLVAAVSVPTLLAGCQTPAAAPSLEARSDPAGAPSIARGPFVAAANPLAVEAGMKVLRRGGSAVDAAVAVQAVLGLVEPTSMAQLQRTYRALSRLHHPDKSAAATVQERAAALVRFQAIAAAYDALLQIVRRRDGNGGGGGGGHDDL